MFMGFLPDTKYAGCACAGNAGNVLPPPRVSDPDMHHGTCVTHVPRCMTGSLNSGFLWSRWWRNCSRHSQRMRNPQFYVSGKRPITNFFHSVPKRLCIMIHWELNIMATILGRVFSNTFSQMKAIEYFIQISLKFVPRDPSDNESTLDKLMKPNRWNTMTCTKLDPDLWRQMVWLSHNTLTEVSKTNCHTGHMHDA